VRSDAVTAIEDRQRAERIQIFQETLEAFPVQTPLRIDLMDQSVVQPGPLVLQGTQGFAGRRLEQLMHNTRESFPLNDQPLIQPAQKPLCPFVQTLGRGSEDLPGLAEKTGGRSSA